MEPIRSTLAVHPAGTQVVAEYSAITAGPSISIPRPRDSRRNMGTWTPPSLEWIPYQYTPLYTYLGAQIASCPVTSRSRHLFLALINL